MASKEGTGPLSVQELEGLKRELFQLRSEASRLISSSLEFSQSIDNPSDSRPVGIIHPRFIQGPDGSEVHFFATVPISPGTLIKTYTASVVYPSLHVRNEQDHTFRVIDVRKGFMPMAWTCFGCMKNVDGIYPHWCRKCGIPLCCPPCEQTGTWHRDECREFQKLKVIRRFLDLGWVHADVAVSRILRRLRASDEFASEFKFLENNFRVLNFLRSPGNREFLDKFNTFNMPFSFLIANGDKPSVTTTYAVMSVMGYSFKPRPDVDLFVPVLSVFKHGCYSNTELYLQQDSFRFEIRAATYIKEGDMIVVDFLQELLLPTPIRQSLLVSRWGIHCHCVRCMDPTERGTFCASIRCASCSRGFLLLNTHVWTPTGPNTTLDCQFMRGGEGRVWTCKNQVKYGNILESEAEAKKLVREMETKAAFTLKDYLKLKGQLEKCFNYHNNHYIMLQLAQVAIRRMNDPDFEARERRRYVLAGIDAGTYLQECGNIMDQVGQFLVTVSPPCARVNGYTLYYKASAMKKYLDHCQRDNNCKKAGASMISNVRERLPLLIQAWKNFLIYKFPVDFRLIEKMSRIFLGLHPNEYFEKLERVLSGKEPFEEKSQVPAARTESAECIVLKSPASSSLKPLDLLGPRRSREVLDGWSCSSSDENESSLHPTRTKSLENLPTGTGARSGGTRTDDENEKPDLGRDRYDLGDPSASSDNQDEDLIRKLFEDKPKPPKKNKLKEALIRRQVEQRRLCQQQLSKKLEQASIHGGEVSFILPRGKGRRYKPVVSLSEPVSELESGAERRSPEMEAQDKAMANPIPVIHHTVPNSKVRPRRLKQPNPKVIRAYNKVFQNLRQPQVENVPLLPTPFDLDYHCSYPLPGSAFLPPSLCPPVPNYGRHVNDALHPRLIPQHQPYPGPVHLYNTAFGPSHHPPPGPDRLHFQHYYPSNKPF